MLKLPPQERGSGYKRAEQEQAEQKKASVKARKKRNWSNGS
jgi:hypothetical protein